MVLLSAMHNEVFQARKNYTLAIESYVLVVILLQFDLDIFAVLVQFNLLATKVMRSSHIYHYNLSARERESLCREAKEL